MLLLKLAIRNITHAGLRTWLNVIVLSVAFVSIVITEGLYDGISEQVKNAEINSNVGSGQFWQKDYDPLNPISFEFSHAKISSDLSKEIMKGNATPILLVPASIFPQHQIQTILLKGIDPNQKVINLPSHIFKKSEDSVSIPAFIGRRMAESSGLNEGDYVGFRWRNIHGTFDAGEIQIIKVVDINTPSTDKDQIWIPLEKLQKMMLAPDQATFISLKKNIEVIPANSSDWIYKDLDYLLKDINNNINRKKIYSSFMYAILLGMALLAIFDTQVLSIFKRRKEMGTLMALGMTKAKVIGLLTIEGCLSGILAFVLGSLYGIPIMTYLAKEGIVLPRMAQQSQFAIGLIFYPKYGIRVYALTAIILFVSVVIVSFLPTYRITKMKPTDAIRGKLS